MNLPFASILGLIFVVLKLCGVVSWPWFWVLSPFILQLILIVAIIIAKSKKPRK